SRSPERPILAAYRLFVSDIGACRATLRDSGEPGESLRMQQSPPRGEHEPVGAEQRGNAPLRRRSMLFRSTRHPADSRIASPGALDHSALSRARSKDPELPVAIGLAAQ